MSMYHALLFAHGQNDRGPGEHHAVASQMNREMRRQREQRPGPQMRHRRELLGIVVLVAALVVVLWPGPLPFLAFGALMLAIVALLLVVVFVTLHRTPR